MNRGKPLERRTPLAQGTTELKRTELGPGVRKQRKRIPGDVRRRVYRRSEGRCVVCRRKVWLQVHHVLPVQRWPELELVQSNMVGVCPLCHLNHEAASRRIRWAELPRCAITLAHSTSGAAAVYLERTYPR